LYMPTINHTAIFTPPNPIRGHSSFPIMEAVMAGGTITNYAISYSLVNGSTYNNLSYPRTGAGGSNASTTVTMTSTTGVAVNDYVFGTNIAPLAIVVSVDNSTNITVSIANIGVVSGILRFNRLPFETVSDATLGQSLTIKIVTASTNATAISSLYINTNSTASARAATYPLDLVTTKITVLDAADSTAIAGVRTLLYATTGNVVTITRASTTATVAHSAHGYQTGQKVVISGAVEGQYNGIQTITVTDVDAYTFTVAGSPATPATGTITSYRVILDGSTDGSGVIEDTAVEYFADLPVTGRIRRGTSGAFYKTSPISGVLSASGLILTVFMVKDT